MSQTEILRRVRLERKVEEAEGICRFEFVCTEGKPLPAFDAGAHVDVMLDGGLIRQYSLCNAPSDTSCYVLGVLREPNSRGGSLAMHALREGDVVQISAPRNHFPLAVGASNSLLLAGGIGVTPILSMAESLEALGETFELHYCTRARERTAFMSRIADAPFVQRVHHHFDDGDAAQRLNIDALLKAQPAGTHLYTCGPKGFMDAVLASARALGWPESSIHYEYFAGAVVEHDGDVAFDVRLARTGKTVRVPADQSVAQALAAAGVDVPVSCEQGVCGTCLTRVLDGTPDHRDMFLTDEERAANDQFTPCCSRAKGPLLVLDL